MQNNLYRKNDDGNQLSKNAQYTGTFMNKEDISIYRLLNQWIDETAPTLYPGYPFTRWTDGGENLPAVFISESLKSKFTYFSGILYKLKAAFSFH